MLHRYSRKVQSWSAWVVVLSLVLQPCNALATPAVEAKRTSPAPTTPIRVADVALKRDGILVGQVVNDAGVGVAEATVQLNNGQQRWQTQTDSQGWFQLPGLRGGNYHLQAAGHAQVLRAWAAGTAPPHASQGVLVTPTTEVVRGQRVVSPNTNRFFQVAKQRLANPWVVGGVVATAVAIPVGIHNADDDDPPATP